MSEQIVPGSRAAKVPEFLDRLLAVESTDTQKRFTQALGAFEREAREAHGMPWKALTAAQATALLTKISGQPDSDATRQAFDGIKGAVAETYYSSEAGMKELGWNGNVAFAPPECLRVIRRGVMQTNTLLQIFKTAAERWLERDAFEHAAALAFCTLFSLAPLVIIVVAIVGIVFGEDAASGQIAVALSDLVGPQAAKAVEEAVRHSRLEEAGLLPTILGVGALIFGATTVFAQMQSALNKFWGVKARPTRNSILTYITVRLLSLGMVLIIGFLMLTSFIVSLGVTGIIEYAREWVPIPGFAVVLIDLAVSLAVTTVLFGMLFKVLPDVRIQWADVWRGAFVTALLFAIGKYLISLYLTHVATASTYGAAGSLVLILLWVYYSSLILFFGTCLTIARILQRGDQVRPKKTAVRTRVVLEENEASSHGR